MNKDDMTGLTPYAAFAKRAGAMKSLLPLSLAAAALLPLAACNNQPKSDAAADAQNATIANAAPIEMPPAIRADKSFRCKDNSLAFVTFFEGDKQALVKDKQDGTPTLLKAEKAGDPLTAEGGWSMTGDDKEITLTRPGKPALTCHV